MNILHDISINYYVKYWIKSLFHKLKTFKKNPSIHPFLFLTTHCNGYDACLWRHHRLKYDAIEYFLNRTPFFLDCTILHELLILKTLVYLNATFCQNFKAISESIAIFKNGHSFQFKEIFKNTDLKMITYACHKSKYEIFLKLSLNVQSKISRVGYGTNSCNIWYDGWS